jgi:hypothetical protein
VYLAVEGFSVMGVILGEFYPPVNPGRFTLPKTLSPHLLHLKLEQCVAGCKIGVDRVDPGVLGDRGVGRCLKGNDIDNGRGSGGVHELDGIISRPSMEAKNASRSTY